MCAKRFTRPSSLATHKRSHTGEVSNSKSPSALHYSLLT
jgi:uncharacterized Zn-finger protein